MNVEYQIVQGVSVKQLVERVEALLEVGWILTGGICAVGFAGSMDYYQAMFKAYE